MQTAVQTVSLFQKTAKKRMILLTLRLGHLSVHFLEALPPPAVRQLFEGFQKPNSSGSNLPF
jgi:hypothetical protein